MLRTVFVRQRPHLEDCVGQNIAAKIHAALHLAVDAARLVKVFTVEGLDDESLGLALERAAVHDPVLHEASLVPFASDADWIIEVGFRPGVTDN